jgi:hypothetical protein
MTEFLQRFPEPEVLAAIRSAAIHSQERLRRRQQGRRKRDDSNKAQIFFRHMASRLPEVPDDLISVLSLKTKDLSQLDLPDMTVDEPTIEPPVAAQPPKDEYNDLFNIPSFEDYREVFNQYPYIWELENPELGRILVLGYASGRNKDTDELVRRNCAVSMLKRGSTDPTEREERSFNDLTSIVGYLQHKEGGIHRSVKVIPYQVGAGVRFWTNTAKGDLPDLNRYFYLSNYGPSPITSRARYEEALSDTRSYKPHFAEAPIKRPV